MRLAGCIAVNNIPNYANNKELWVCTLDPNSKEFWFYGAWDNVEEENCQNALAETEYRVLVYNPSFVNANSF